MISFEELISETLSISKDLIVDSLSYGDIHTWDSLGHTALIAALETQYGVKLEDDVTKLLSIKDIKNALFNKDIKQNIAFKNEKKDKVNHGLKDIYYNTSSICYIDIKNSKLYYRGFEVEYLTLNHSYEEVLFLLLYKRLPTKTESKNLVSLLTKPFLITKQLFELIKCCSNYKTEDILKTFVIYCKNINLANSLELECISLLNKIPAVFLLRRFLTENPDSSYSQFEAFYINFTKEFKSYTEYLCSCLNIENQNLLEKLFILQIEHESNASTFSARIGASAESSIYDSILSAMAVFCGSRHGGALLFSSKQMHEIHKNTINIESYVKERFESKKPIWGYGHRVYNKEDPRSRVMKNIIEKSVQEAKNVDFIKYFEIITKMNEVMRNNNYPFYPNVDLYAPIIYKIAGLKEEGILSLFIIARIGGWAAHIIEQKNGPNHLLRPRLSYIGSIKNYDAKINT